MLIGDGQRIVSGVHPFFLDILDPDIALELLSKIHNVEVEWRQPGIPR
jgi:hypothetical protein